jgi:hypothetical protein
MTVVLPSLGDDRNWPTETTAPDWSLLVKTLPL